MVWTPRSERLSGHRPTYDGVPEHMHAELRRWMTSVDETHARWSTGSRLAVVIALRTGVTFRDYYSPTGETLLVEASAQGGDEKVLDVIEGYLHVAGDELAKDLRGLFAIAGHTLTVGPDNKTLVEVVEPAMHTLATEALQPEDRASHELQEAWTNAYGRGPDASDAWDHAIKAVEALVGPLVEPNNAASTLGSQMAVIRNDATSKNPKWSATALKRHGGESAHGAVLSLLQKIWVNPDRHGSGTPTSPTLAQARAVVVLAVSVVQMAREGELLS